MKKTLLFLGCMALFVAGCNKIENVEEPVQDSPRHLKVNITVNNAETRAVKTGWTAGDKIYVAFDVCFQEEISSYLTLTYNGSSWTSEFSDDVLEELLLEKGNGRLAAAYISTDRKPDFLYVPTSEDNPYIRTLDMVNSDGLTGIFLSAQDVIYTVEDRTLTAQLEMGLKSNEFIHFYLGNSQLNLAGNYSLRCNKLRPTHFDRFTYLFIDIEGGFHTEAGPWTEYYYGELGEPIPGSYYEGGIEFNCILDGTGIGSEKEFVFYLIDNSGTPNDTSDDVTYSLTKTTTLMGGEAIRFPSLEYSGEWELLTPSDINPEFSGFDGEVIW